MAVIAVYAALLGTAGFVITGRQAIVDRGDLRAEITLEPMTWADDPRDPRVAFTVNGPGPGTYQFWCSLEPPGGRMKGTLTIAP